MHKRHAEIASVQAAIHTGILGACAAEPPLLRTRFQPLQPSLRPARMSEICPPQFKPRKKPVDTHKILKSNGTLVAGASAPLADEQAQEALRLMMVGRAFDTKCFSLQRQGKMGTFAPLHGQEASIVGSAMALNPATDWIAPQYREMPAALRHGLPLKNIILYRQGHPEGGVVPAGVKVMQFQISLAAQIPHAVGLAWGCLLYTSPSPRDRTRSRMPSSA